MFTRSATRCGQSMWKQIGHNTPSLVPSSSALLSSSVGASSIVSSSHKSNNRSLVTASKVLRSQEKDRPISSPTSDKVVTGSQYAPAELLTVLQETIKTHGPLPVSRYMTLCLAHPTLGYYTTRQVFGSRGDFITSPEISQVFGELLAIWFVTQWAAQGSASKVRVVELGPGKGTLLADILRTFKSLPKGSSPPVTSIHLVESSEALREVQKKKLNEAGFGGIDVHWWSNVVEVPQSEDEFTVVIAHEFFDALPIHIFENTPNGWREVLVDVDVADSKSVIVSNAPKEPLRLVLAPGATPASTLYTRLASLSNNSSSTPPSSTPAPSSSLSFDTTLPPTNQRSASSTEPAPSAPDPAASPTLARFARLPQGSRIEISPASWEVARDVGKLFSYAPKGAAGLVIDYGDAKAFGRSWRGFRKHQVVDPLTEPGHTDLTANVDFAYLAEALQDEASTHGPLTQRTFLRSLGLDARLSALLRGAPFDRQKEIASAAERLIDKLGMGTQYKVMAITPKGDGQDGKAFPFVPGVEEELEKADRGS